MNIFHHTKVSLSINPTSFIKMISALSSSVVQEYLTTGEKREFVEGKTFIREVR